MAFDRLYRKTPPGLKQTASPAFILLKQLNFKHERTVAVVSIAVMWNYLSEQDLALLLKGSRGQHEGLPMFSSGL